MRAGLRQCHAERAGNGRNGERDPLGETDAVALHLGDPQPWVRELVGKQPEAGDDRRPAPPVGSELEQLDREHGAGLGAFDEYRPAHRVHA